MAAPTRRRPGRKRPSKHAHRAAQAAGPKDSSNAAQRAWAEARSSPALPHGVRVCFFSAGQNAFPTLQTKLRILVLSDAHGEWSVMPPVSRRIDAILVGGDSVHGDVDELLSEETIERQKAELEAYLTSVRAAYGVPIYFVTGNHDSPLAATFDIPETHYLTAPVSLAAGLTLVGMSGACDGLRRKGQVTEQLRGWPYGAESNSLHEAVIRREDVGERLRAGEYAVEQRQLRDALQAVSEVKGQIFVLSHQGPAGSRTSFYRHPTKDSIASTGSGALEQVKQILMGQNRLCAWVHGHTHHPEVAQDGVTFCPGAAQGGRHMILEGETDPEGRWTWRVAAE